MKKIVLISILLFLVKSGFCQEIKVVKDTIEINLNRKLGPWIVYKDKFYCFFIKDNGPYGFTEEFYVFNRSGEILRKVTPPSQIRIYYDLFIKNDSVFVLDYYGHNTYFINDNFEFIETKRADDLIYQDSSYYVTSIDHGEWGGTTWFINKHNQKEYELGISTPVINKINNNYILTTGEDIFEIKDPTKLKLCIAPRNYTTAFLTGKRIEENSFMKGVHEIFDNTSNKRNLKLFVATSTILNNKLYHLCVDSNICYLASLRKGKLNPVYVFEKGLIPYRRSYHDRNRILNNSYQSIQFTTPDENLFGILEFKGDRIVQTYFHNAYKAPILGTQRSNELLINQFDFFLKNMDSLNLRSVDSIEVKLKADDITPTYHFSNNIKENIDLETPRIYRKIEDSSIVILSKYYYASKTNKLEIISFNWEENTLFDKEIFFFTKQQMLKQKLRQAMLAERMNWIREVVSGKFGKPVRDMQGANFRKIIWEWSGIVINLDGNFMNTPEYYNSVELTFYKK